MFFVKLCLAFSLPPFCSMSCSSSFSVLNDKPFSVLNGKPRSSSSSSDDDDDDDGGEGGANVFEERVVLLATMPRKDK